MKPTRSRKPSPVTAAAEGESQGPWPAWERSDWLALGALAAIVLALFGAVLHSAYPPVLSHEKADTASEFIYWRQFGFGELAKGNLPFWNPHVFSGLPFFEGFQSALLYPPNAIFLVLPVGLAINVSIAFHTLLAGFAMYLWSRFRGLRREACFLAGAGSMMSGQFFLHVYAGHLSNLCAMPWVPLVLLALDGLFAAPGAGWALLGSGAAAMLVLAGHPQYVYYTAVTGALYCALRLPGARARGKTCLWLAAMAGLAAALSAVQLLPGLAGTEQTVRGGSGLSYDFAATFGFPPENLATLVAPDILGSLPDGTYWGRALLWEMSAFLGATLTFLAVVGCFGGGRLHRATDLAMAAVLLALALGAHTPLHRLLYEVLPGFDKFRGASKFGHPMSLFVLALAAAGYHRLLEEGLPSRRWVVGALVAAALLAAPVPALQHASGDAPEGHWWSRTMQAVHEAGYALGDTHEAHARFRDPAIRRQAAGHAALSLATAAAVMALLAATLMLGRQSRGCLHLLGVLSLMELALFTYPDRPTFDAAQTVSPGLRRLQRTDPGEHRFLNIQAGNSAMAAGALDLWGDDPLVLRRYAELMFATQGFDPDAASQYLTPKRGHPLHALVRCKYVLAPPEGQVVWKSRAPVLPRVLLVNDYVVAKGRDRSFAALSTPGFDPARVVVLEEEPEPRPSRRTSPGTVRVVEESTDHLVVEAQTPGPAVLLVTDNYHPGWTARGLTESGQAEYRVMPADYILRAVPLAAGRHRLLMEYRPRLLVPGTLVTLAGVASWLGLAWRRTRRRAAGRG